MGAKRKSDAVKPIADMSSKKACTDLVPVSSSATAVSPADGPLVALAKVLMETLELDIATQILSPMMPEFEYWDAQAFLPESRGGILPLSPELYREKVPVDKELMCMATLQEVGLAPGSNQIGVCCRLLLCQNKTLSYGVGKQGNRALGHDAFVRLHRELPRPIPGQGAGEFAQVHYTYQCAE